MVIRHRKTSLLWFLLLLLSTASSQPDAECHKSINDDMYDFSALAGDHTISRTRSSPPTEMLDTLRFDVCKELSPLDDVPQGDQCPSGTWACLTKTNIRKGESNRVFAVIPVAQEPDLQPEYEVLHSDPRGVKITLHGPSYPLSTTTEPAPQSFVLNLYCATEGSEPELESYDGKTVVARWNTSSACNFRAPKDEDSKTPEKDGEAVGSGIGWFFLLLFIAFAGYFALGAYYNYTTYGATGVDLIPHRDFWREVPYMLRDVVSHLCSSFQSRHSSSRGGYISV